MTAQVRISTQGVEIRQWHGRRVWFVPLDMAMGILARAAQTREANKRLGRKNEVDDAAD